MINSSSVLSNNFCQYLWNYCRSEVETWHVRVTMAKCW